MQNSSLIAQNLMAIRAGQQLFHSLNFQLNSGQALQILGKNGAGKSTLLKMMAGLRAPDAGSILFNAKSIQDELAHYQAELAYLGHRLGLKLHLSVKENLRGLRHDAHLLRALDLESLQTALLSHLSQGQKQRVALARVCFSHKQIWILDEPFAALDQVGFELLQKIIQEHLQCGGIVILSSHRPLELTQGVQTIYLEKSDV